MKVMIDTCISLDFIQQREPFFNDAKKVFEEIKNERIEGYITVKSLADIHYVTKHVLHEENKVREILINLLTILKLVDSSASDARNALASSIHDYEDAIMMTTSIANNMDYIVTRNTKDYKSSYIPVILPKELIKKVI